MKKEPSSSYPILRWGIKDILVLLLIAIIIFLISWIVQSEKTKDVVFDVKEKVEREADFYGRELKDSIGDVIKKKTGN